MKKKNNLRGVASEKLDKWIMFKYEISQILHRANYSQQKHTACLQILHGYESINMNYLGYLLILTTKFTASFLLIMLFFLLKTTYGEWFNRKRSCNLQPCVYEIQLSPKYLIHWQIDFFSKSLTNIFTFHINSARKHNR